MQAERIAPAVKQQRYRGEATDLRNGSMVRFERKDLEAVEVYETHLIAESLDGKQFSVGIEEWNRSGVTTTITVTRKTIFYRHQLRPFRDHYYCTGPDETRFDNSSLATLREVLRRHYGKVEIVKAWEQDGDRS